MAGRSIRKAELKELDRTDQKTEKPRSENLFIPMKDLVRKTNDIGYTYIEIDLTAQRMVFYKDGTPTADAQIVSGNPYRAQLCYSCGLLYNR